MGRLALLLGGLLLAAASGSEGERAETGQCPTGEVCSPDTPGGLYFEGPTFSDDGWFPSNNVKVTAVGGEQTITIDPVDFGVYLPAFEADFDSSNQSVRAVVPPSVTLRGELEGSGHLRILDPVSGELYDRIEVSAMVATRIRLEPLFFELYSVPEEETPLVYSGAPSQWVVKVLAGTRRLVDETLVIEAGDATSVARVTSLKWDRAEVEPTAGASALSLRVTLGDGQQELFQADLTDTIDEIADVPDAPMEPTLDASSAALVCFYGQLDGRLVRGLDWSGEVAKPDATVEPLEFMGNCAQIFADQVGVHLVTVSAGNVSRDWTVTVAPPQPAPPPPAALPSPPPAASGASTLLDSLARGAAPRFLWRSPGERTAAFRLLSASAPTR